MASNPLLEPYIKLTEFLGLALGPDYEIVLYDLTDRNPSTLAVANGHDSGRSVDAPFSAPRDKNGETSDYRLHYPVKTASGKTLRSNTCYIKDGQHLIGMLCVNFDDSRYRALGAQLMELGHPESFDARKISGMAGQNGLGSFADMTDQNNPNSFSNRALQNDPNGLPRTAALNGLNGFADMTNQNGLHFFSAAENEYPGSADEVTTAAVRRELDILGVTPDRLTAAERHQIIAALDQSGIFRIKGSVKKVASELDCSQASVYRYLSHVRNGQAGSKKDR